VPFSNSIGKLFYFELDGQGGLPLLHFGMSGFLQVSLFGDTASLSHSSEVKGQAPFKYVQKIKHSSDWPPKYAKVPRQTQYYLTR
jgi:hypothetical protein